MAKRDNANRDREGARRLLLGFDRFVRDYTGGVRPEDFRRLFDVDATAAYQVLARDEERDEPEEPLRRFLHRTKTVFLGLSYKLTPVRRLLFVACLLCTVFGLLDWAPSFRTGGFSVESSPIWFVAAIVGLAFLLTLELVDQVRVRDELEVARALQSSLLPRRAPELEEYSIAHTYRTANEIGGDYYDFARMPDGRLAVMVGDASGHGLAAGLLMAIANAALKLAMDLDPSPAAVLELLNRALFRTSDRRAFMSLFYSLLDPKSGELVYASAGHPYPLLRRVDGSIEELGEGCFPLGVRATLHLPEGRARLEPGDTLLLFSDGLPEAIDQRGVAFSYEKVHDLLAQGGPVETIETRLREALESHLGAEPLQDDFSVVLLRRRGTVPPPPPPV